MARFSPQDLADHLKDGLLSFPATAFQDDLEVDEAAYVEHIEWQSSYPVAGLFAAGGTGEGFSLTVEENHRVTQLAVQASSPEVPVLGSTTGSTKSAIANAQGARRRGSRR